MTIGQTLQSCTKKTTTLRLREHTRLIHSENDIWFAGKTEMVKQLLWFRSLWFTLSCSHQVIHIVTTCGKMWLRSVQLNKFDSCCIQVRTHRNSCLSFLDQTSNKWIAGIEQSTCNLFVRDYTCDWRWFRHEAKNQNLIWLVKSWTFLVPSNRLKPIGKG